MAEKSSGGLASVFLFALWAISMLGCAAGPKPENGQALGSARHVFLVRHTEREWDGQDPPLTVVGEARAQALAQTLRDSGVTAIITTQWKRTRDSAKPLASLLKITPEVIPVHDDARKNVEAVAAAVRRHKDETVLVVGHITVTGVIAALGGPRLPTICEPVFSQLFFFTPSLGEDGLVRLLYGAPEDISRNCRLNPD